jgi:hypothetical protein
VNLLDENFPDDQRVLLQKWGLRVRQIGRDIAAAGTADDVIIPLLHRLKGVTFFTHDQDFFKKPHCHAAYCLVWLDVDEDKMAAYARRFLCHHLFATNSKRMGVVARVGVQGLRCWRLDQAEVVKLPWPRDFSFSPTAARRAERGTATRTAK